MQPVRQDVAIQFTGKSCREICQRHQQSVANLLCPQGSLMSPLLRASAPLRETLQFFLITFSRKTSATFPTAMIHHAAL